MSHTARLAGISRLYHFQKFNQDHLKDVLVNQRVRCANPAELNDPWDCQPWFREDVLDDPSALEEYVKLVNSLQPVGGSMSQAEFNDAIRYIRENPQQRREILEMTAQRTFAAIPKKWRIYCLTPFCDSILMWSHYADNHRGICLEFSASNQLFGSAEEVEYASSYPRWTPQACMGEGAAKVLLTKSDAWKYEREFRIITFTEKGTELTDDHPLVTKDGFLKLPPRALKSVIVGCNADYESIKAEVVKAAAHVRVRRVSRAAAEYQLQVEE